MNKWFALTGLYLVQGLPHGFFGQAMPVLLRQQGPCRRNGQGNRFHICSVGFLSVF